MAVADRIDVVVAGEPRTVLMSFSRLSKIVTVIGGINDIAERLHNPDISCFLLAEVLRPPSVKIRTQEDAENIVEESAISPSEGAVILAWVEEHVVDFILSRANSTASLAMKLQEVLKGLMHTSDGLQA